MRGEIIHFDDNQGIGYISGDDGQRYGFARADIRQLVAVGRGMRVDFSAEGGNARDVFVLSQAAQPRAARETAEAAAPGAAHPLPPVVVRTGDDAELGMFAYFRRALTARYAVFRGRARRKEYWSVALFSTLLLVAIGLAGAAADVALGNFDNGDAPWATATLLGLAAVAMIVPGLAVTVRRIHDLGLSGWFYLLVLIPYVGGLIIFVFTVMPSQKNENKWGPVPAGVV